MSNFSRKSTYGERIEKSKYNQINFRQNILGKHNFFTGISGQFVPERKRSMNGIYKKKVRKKKLFLEKFTIFYCCARPKFVFLNLVNIDIYDIAIFSKKRVLRNRRFRFYDTMSSISKQIFPEQQYFHVSKYFPEFVLP